MSEASSEIQEVRDDMMALQDEVDLLLISAAMMDHENKQMLIQIIRMLRGQSGTGWKIDIRKKIIKKR